MDVFLKGQISIVGRIVVNFQRIISTFSTENNLNIKVST